MRILSKARGLSLIAFACLTVGSAKADLLVNYAFDGDTSSVTNLASNGDFDGTLNGAAQIVYNAERDSDVLALDGVDANENCAGVIITEQNFARLNLDSAGVATIAAWVYTEHTGYPHQAIFSQGPMANVYFGIRPDSEGTFLTNGGPSVVNSDEWETLALDYHGRWTHVAVVMDGNTSTFYADGLPFGSADRGGPIQSPLGVSAVGFEQGLDWRWTFDGFLDDFQLYDHALTAEEIADLAGLVIDPAPGDANRDGKVDEADAARLAANWGSGSEAEPATWDEGNFNGDWTVGVMDAAILAANWGFGAEESVAIAAPEPSVAVLILAGSCLVLTLRRRQRQGS